MRIRKIRGHNRRHRQVEHWVQYNLPLRKDLIDNYNSDHIDIVIHPWCDISLSNSMFPEPKRKTKLIILKGLLDIYDSLETQLDTLNVPYYLALWLNEPRFSKSQVVCAINDKIEYYENVFTKVQKKEKLNLNNYSILKARLEQFGWSQFVDEDHIDSDIVGIPDDYENANDYYETKKWFEKLMKKEHRAYDTDGFKIYSFTKGNIWVGKKKK